MQELEKKLNQAIDSGQLLQESAKNIADLYRSSESAVVKQSIDELVDNGQWQELNDRFFRTLSFGTGGLRGRTIGRVVTTAESGTPNELGRPQFACTGTNAMNDYNIVRACLGLCAQMKEYFVNQAKSGKPALVLAHDTRHFSRHFAQLAAKVASESGIDVYLFDGPRSTPELSFALRHLSATAGVVLTASHNPPHDNGFKAYFTDGGQVVEPHASGIIAKVNAIASDNYTPLPEDQQGSIQIIGEELDQAYMQRLESLLLRPELVQSQNDMKVVFTPIHGTGGVITLPMLERLGFTYLTVKEQDVMDGRFPTVKSPNPENAEALDMAKQLAESENADLVIGTDPDSDRMGVLVRGADGEMKLLTGNQIGSLLAYYRVTTLFELGILNDSNKSNATIIKTLVTTDLQKAIAEKAGIRCVETLTGFKYIGAKLEKYEKAIPAEHSANYRSLSEQESRELRLQHSTYYVYGGEESYGYSGYDFVRDKDANGSVVMFAEVAAYAKSLGMTLDQLLDKVYSEYGLHIEHSHNLIFEGAEGAGKIKDLAASYADSPPQEIDGIPVVDVIDYGNSQITDSEGDQLPTEKMIGMQLDNGWRLNIRPSGTEPKIKYYLFAKLTPEDTAASNLDTLKAETISKLQSMWQFINTDAHARLE